MSGVEMSGMGKVKEVREGGVFTRGLSCGLAFNQTAPCNRLLKDQVETSAGNTRSY